MRFLSVILISGLFFSCTPNKREMKKILFLHHSTGWNILLGNTNKYLYKLTGKSDMHKFFNSYYKENGENYLITERFFPKESPYGWKNYPFDYFNIWVKNAGENPYMEEPTLEILTNEYDLIIFKHCFPGSNIMNDSGTPEIDSEKKRIENYKLQYNALKNKMREFPDTKFIVWTLATQVENRITEDEAKRAFEFYKWIIEDWDEKGDNIYVWDFYKYETEGGLYMLDKYAVGPNDSHPNKEFSSQLLPVFCKYIIKVIEGLADK